MLLKTLPLPAAPHSSCLLRTQPLLHFRFLRFRLSPILPQLQRPARSQTPPALPLRQRQMPRRSLLQQSPPHLPQLPLPPAHRYSPPLRPPPLHRRLRRTGSPPDKSCPPSSRRCQESPSTAPA